MDFEKKMNSKTSRFFEWLFAIVMVNLFTIILCVPLITLFPAITGAYATIISFKNDGTVKPIKRYFKKFWENIEKSFLFGIIFIVIVVVAFISMRFYQNHFSVDSFIGQAGYWVMGLCLLIVLLLSLHIPLLIVNFPKLNLIDDIRLSMYMCFRYILSSLIILVSLVVTIIGVVAFPIWVFIGISLPIFLVIKFTEPTYYYLKKIDIEKIIEKSKEIEDEDDSRD